MAFYYRDPQKVEKPNNGSQGDQLGEDYQNIVIDEELEETFMNIKPHKEEKYWFQFLSYLLLDAIEKYPRNVDLKIVSSFI